MSVSMTMNGAVLPVLAMYIVAAEEQVPFYGLIERVHLKLA
jgi:methylmalonyl-CoA mutase N-terminal domain/subunit